MKVAIVYFTYGPDIKPQVGCVERSKPLPGDVVFCIDANVKYDASCVPPSIRCVESRFRRRGNLNGLPCLRGQMEMYLSLFEAGYELIIKVDSDTIVTDWTFLLGDGKPEAEFRGYFTPPRSVLGCAYSLNRAQYEEFLVKLQAAEANPDPNWAYSDDKTFSMWSRDAFCVTNTHCVLWIKDLVGKALPKQDVYNLNNNRIPLYYYDHLAAAADPGKERV